MARKRQARTIALKRRVSWADADPAGIMNTPRAFDYAVDVMEAFYLKVLGFSFGELIAKHGMGNPFVHIEADFHAPLAQGKPLTLTVAVERLGRSSISWRVDARRADRRLAFRVKASPPSSATTRSVRSPFLPRGARSFPAICPTDGARLV